MQRLSSDARTPLLISEAAVFNEHGCFVRALCIQGEGGRAHSTPQDWDLATSCLGHWHAPTLHGTNRRCCMPPARLIYFRQSVSVVCVACASSVWRDSPKSSFFCRRKDSKRRNLSSITDANWVTSSNPYNLRCKFGSNHTCMYGPLESTPDYRDILRAFTRKMTRLSFRRRGEGGMDRAQNA